MKIQYLGFIPVLIVAVFCHIGFWWSIKEKSEAVLPFGVMCMMFWVVASAIGMRIALS